MKVTYQAKTQINNPKDAWRIWRLIEKMGGYIAYEQQMSDYAKWLIVQCNDNQFVLYICDLDAWHNNIVKIISPETMIADLEKAAHATNTPQIETAEGFKVEPYTFLSNMTPCHITMYGLNFSSLENAYQASKCANKQDMAQFCDITPYRAKRLGRKIVIREDFDKLKLDFMEVLLRRKFSDHNPELKHKLIATAGVTLVEYNHWKDTFWGICDGVGENNLGKLLMKIRDELMVQS